MQPASGYNDIVDWSSRRGVINRAEEERLGSLATPHTKGLQQGARDMGSPWGTTRAARASGFKKPKAIAVPLWESKRCWRCKEEKHADQFVRLKSGSLSRNCRACQAAHKRETREKQRGTRQGAHLSRTYGITKSEYAALFAQQGGVCAICRQPERTSHRKDGKPSALAVDHDHTTGEVRGLLCGSCNQGIGSLGDDAARLQAAILYLQKGAKIA